MAGDPNADAGEPLSRPQRPYSTEDDARAVITAHSGYLATPTDVARATGVTESAVSNWLRRRTGFAREALVIDVGQVQLLWWPSVLRWLAGRGIPADPRAPVMAGFRDDEAIRDLIRAHAADLVTPVEVARRAGVGKSVVSNWFRRRPDLEPEANVASLGKVRILWWPSVRDWLTRHGVAFAEDTRRQPGPGSRLQPAAGAPQLDFPEVGPQAGLGPLASTRRRQPTAGRHTARRGKAPGA